MFLQLGDLKTLQHVPDPHRRHVTALREEEEEEEEEQEEEEEEQHYYKL